MSGKASISKSGESNTTTETFDEFNATLESLCKGSLTGIPQSVTMQKRSQVNTIVGNDGTEAYTVQLKIYKTEEICDQDKTDWWKNAVTNAQFTMTEADQIYTTLYEALNLVTQKLKAGENFRAEKKRRIIKKY